MGSQKRKRTKIKGTLINVAGIERRIYAMHHCFKGDGRPYSIPLFCLIPCRGVTTTGAAGARYLGPRPSGAH